MIRSLESSPAIDTIPQSLAHEDRMFARCGGLNPVAMR